MSHIALLRSLLLLILTSTACAPSPAPTTSQSSPPGGAQAAATTAPSGPPRTLVIAIRVEPATLAAKALESGGVTLTTTRRLFNATLLHFDERGLPAPYLAQDVPQLNSDTWQVFPDGRMETTYRLKSGITWHDGQALTAEDFVFAHRVYSTPELGIANVPPTNLLDEVVAPDAQTVVMRWRRPNVQAGLLTDAFPPLPRHLLESAFQSASPEAFASHPYWTRDYIGLGPFRLDRWEPASFIEASAFDRHTLGPARIGRVRIVFIPDPNTTLANILAGDVHFSADDSIRFQQGAVLKREWGPRNAGTVLVKPDLWRGTYIQFRSEMLGAPALADVRVRRALSHTVDRQGLSDGLFEGEGILSDVPLIPSTVDYIALVEQSAAKYPLDPRRAEALLAEAGFTRGGDGVFSRPTDGRISFELKTNASIQNESEMSILAAGWRQAGIEVREAIVPASQAQDGQVRNSFPGLYTFSTPLGEETLASHHSSRIPTPENRWIGNSRGGWSNVQFDRLSESFTASLDQRERAQLVAQMVRIFSEEVPAVSLYFNPIPVAHVAELRGPRMVAPASAIAWDIHQWEFR